MVLGPGPMVLGPGPWVPVNIGGRGRRTGLPTPIWPRTGPSSQQIKIRDHPLGQNFAANPAVIVVWPGADQKSSHFCKPATTFLGVSEETGEGFAANMPVYTTSYNVPPPGGALGPHRAQNATQAGP